MTRQISITQDELQLEGNLDAIWEYLQYQGEYQHLTGYNALTHYMSSSGYVQQIDSMNAQHLCNAARKYIRELMTSVSISGHELMVLVENLLRLDELALQHFSDKLPPIIELCNRYKDIPSGTISVTIDGLQFSGDCDKIADMANLPILSNYSNYRNSGTLYVCNEVMIMMAWLVINKPGIFNMSFMVLEHPMLAGLVLGVMNE